MARKNYQVKAKTGEAWQSIHEQLIKSDSVDSLIPNRKVTCKNPLYDSPRRGTYQLSLAEVEQLRLHSNILSVELDPGYHDDCLPPLELFSNDRFSNPVKNYRALVKPSTTDVTEVTNSLRMTSGNSGEGTTNWIRVRNNSGESPAMLYWDQLPTILTDYGVYKSIPADTTDADPELDNLLDTVNVIQLTTSGVHQLVVCADAKIFRVEWWKGTSGGAGGTKSFPQTEAWSSKRDLTSDIMEDYANRGIKYEVLNLGYLSAGEHTIKCWIENGPYANQAFESWDYNPSAIAWQLLRLPMDGYTSDHNGANDAYQDITTWPTIIPKTNPTSSEKNRTGYQTLRTSSDYNNNWGSNDDVPVTSNISYTNDGRDVDIIILDDGVWSGHPEFISTDDDPPNWIPGNVLSRHGKSGVLDVLLDGPYYIDPEWFDADQASRTTIRWDGTRVPVESVAIEWWEDRTKRSSKFGGVEVGEIVFSTGSIAGQGYYTRDRHCGNDLVPPTGSYVNCLGCPTEYNGKHGTPCASLAYGKNFGWAFNCNKWTLANFGGAFTDACFKIQRIFHRYKPNNLKFPTNPKDPTISSNSWGGGVNQGYAFSTGVRSYEYRGTAGTYDSTAEYNSGSRPTIPHFVTRGNAGVLSNYVQGVGNLSSFQVQLSSYMEPTIDPNTGEYDYSGITGNWANVISELEEMIEEYEVTENGVTITHPGIIVSFASGNAGEYVTKEGDPDFNNKVGSASASPEYFNNRQGYPAQVGYNPATPVFTVGALDNEFKTRTDFSVDAALRDDASYYGEANKNHTKAPANAETLGMSMFGSKFGPRLTTPLANRFIDFYAGWNDFSNRGSYIDFYAPGDGTLAAAAEIETSYISNDAKYYERNETHPVSGKVYQDYHFGGTSAACPVVSGHLAAAMQQNRGWSAADLKNALNSAISVDPNVYTGLPASSDPDDLNWLNAYSAYGSDIKVIKEYTGSPTTENVSLVASGGIHPTRPVNERFTITSSTSETHKLKIYGIREFLETDSEVELTLRDGFYPISINTDQSDKNELGKYTMRINSSNNRLLEVSDDNGVTWNAFTVLIVNGNFYHGGSGKYWYRLNLQDDSIGLPIQTGPSYTITPNNFTFNEGDTLVTTVTTNEVAAGTTLYWSLVGLSAADLSSGDLQGDDTVTINSSQGDLVGSISNISHTFSSDTTTEGTENFEFKLFTDAARNNEVKKISLSLLDTSKSGGTNEPDPFTPGTDGYNSKSFPDNIKRTHTNGDTTVETAGPYFVGSVPISFRKMATYFKQGGYVDDTPIKASEYFRNTDNTQTGVNVPNATENEFDTAGSTKISGDNYPNGTFSGNGTNLSLKTFRNSIKRYYSTCGSINSVGGTVISQYSMGRWNGSKGIDWDNRNNKDTSSRSDGNLIRNVEKHMFINATCYSDDEGTNGNVGSLVSGEFDKKAGARLVEPTLTVRNSIIFVNGRCFGSGGLGGYRTTGPKGSSDPGKHGGPGLKVKHTGSVTPIYVWKDAQIFGGGGGGESGEMGDPGGAGVCREEYTQTQEVSFCPINSSGGYVLQGCPAGWTSSGWSGTAEPCMTESTTDPVTGEVTVRVRAYTQQVTCSRIVVNEADQADPTQGVGGRGGNGKGYNQGRSDGEPGTLGVNPTCPFGTLIGGWPAGDGTDGGDGGEWGRPGENTRGTTGDGGNGGAAICGSPFKLKGPYINSNTVKGEYNGECDGSEQTIDPDPGEGDPTITVVTPKFVRFHREGMLLMVTAPAGEKVRFRLHNRNQDRSGWGVPYRSMTVAGNSITRNHPGDVTEVIELADGMYPITWNDLNKTNVNLSGSGYYNGSGLDSNGNKVIMNDSQMDNDLLSINLKDNTASGNDCQITILNPDDPVTDWVKSKNSVIHSGKYIDENGEEQWEYEALNSYWHTFLQDYGVYKSNADVLAVTPSLEEYQQLTYTFQFRSGDRGPAGSYRGPEGDYPILMMSDNAGQVWVNGERECHTSWYRGHDGETNWTDPNYDYTEKHWGTVKVRYTGGIDTFTATVMARIKNSPYNMDCDVMKNPPTKFDSDTPCPLLEQTWKKNPAGIAFAIYKPGQGLGSKPIFNSFDHLPGKSQANRFGPAKWSFQVGGGWANILGVSIPYDPSFYVPNKATSGELTISPTKYGSQHVENVYTVTVAGKGGADTVQKYFTIK